MQLGSIVKDVFVYPPAFSPTAAEIGHHIVLPRGPITGLVVTCSIRKCTSVRAVALQWMH